MNTDIAAVILAGGKSSRMGRDKACIEVRGQSLLRRVYDVAAQCCPSVYVVTHQPSVYKFLLPDTCIWIPEGDHGGDRRFQGPLVGFAQALEQVDAEWILLLACDLPFLNVEILKAWIRKATTSETTDMAWVPYCDRQWEPLCALYHQRCKHSLQSFVRLGGRSFQAWLNSQPVRRLTVLSPRMLYNCNTLNDLNSLPLEP